MAEERVERRLAAILAADVVGYSKLMGEDESGTLAALRELRAEVVDPRISEHKGRLFKTTGDGLLVEFSSVVNAVTCAADIQRAMAARSASMGGSRIAELRIGVNLGDVIVEGDDVFGDGVNVAARLEGLAPPGGIAVSAMVRDNIGNRLDLPFEDIGEQSLKNIAAAVRVYMLRPGGIAPPAPVLTLPGKPSIAVLPFTNMSSDPEHEFFADGMTEDLITDLSRNSGLFVIARNSTFAYKGRSVDVRRIASDLGVRYLLEGSARRAAGRVRINVQLIDAIGGNHLWAERFDRDLADIFAVQDEVIAKIVDASIGRLSPAAPRVRPKNMEAYDLCLRARWLAEQSPQASREAKLLLQQAIGLDSRYAEAHRLLSMNFWLGWTHWGEPEEPNRRLAVETAEKAVTLDQNDAACHSWLGYILAYDRRWPESEAEFAVAVHLDPNHAEALAWQSDLASLGSQPLFAIELIEKALRLNPRPDCWYYLLLGQAQYAAHQYQAAIQTLRREETYRSMSRRFLAASLAQAGQLEEARREADMFLLTSPHFTISHWVATQPFRDDEARDHFVDGYRKAGLPE